MKIEPGPAIEPGRVMPHRVVAIEEAETRFGLRLRWSLLPDGSDVPLRLLTTRNGGQASRLRLLAEALGVPDATDTEELIGRSCLIAWEPNPNSKTGYLQPIWASVQPVAVDF